MTSRTRRCSPACPSGGSREDDLELRASLCARRASPAGSRSDFGEESGTGVAGRLALGELEAAHLSLGLDVPRVHFRTVRMAEVNEIDPEMALSLRVMVCSDFRFGQPGGFLVVAVSLHLDETGAAGPGRFDVVAQTALPASQSPLGYSTDVQNTFG